MFKFGFSIAEAMVTLLIVSLALAAAAPIISKNIKNTNNVVSIDNTKLVPSGAIMAFNLGECPSGWHKLTRDYAGADGAFIRNMGGEAKARGEVQQDAVPNITFVILPGVIMSENNWNASSLRHGNIDYTRHHPNNKQATNDASSQPWREYKISYDASKSVPSYGRDDATEVRPKNIAFLYCEKE